ncbi:hypothetical protein DPMN_016381 [Dreissena polymorpha]|uniref:Uncharacterized protein n=1 Tax=Dreissena polymorpha TaxID=45954 RepID=A0A9D4NCU4_DREPO|nr:hypothetical protein DPMN_016381 [Dreissena polymorpha]
MIHCGTSRLLCGLCGKGNTLDPLRKLVDHHEYVLIALTGFGQRAQEIHLIPLHWSSSLVLNQGTFPLTG